jgi:cellulose biosynthesis protein BcsQ
VIAVSRPYVLAIVSHKGGTGRTAAALSLAWSFARAGRKVSLVDADPQRSTSIIALNAQGQCTWPNVRFFAGLEALAEPLPGDLVVIDSPPLTDRTSRPVLHVSNGLVLTCLADPLSIRTVPAAATIIEAAKNANPELDLLGLLLCIYNAQDPVQNAMMSRLTESHKDLLLEPAIPYQATMRNWPLHPGSDPPAGAATEAFGVLARNLDPKTRAPSVGAARRN